MDKLTSEDVNIMDTVDPEELEKVGSVARLIIKADRVEGRFQDGTPIESGGYTGIEVKATGEGEKIMHLGATAILSVASEGFREVGDNEPMSNIIDRELAVLSSIMESLSEVTMDNIMNKFRDRYKREGVIINSAEDLMGKVDPSIFNNLMTFLDTVSTIISSGPESIRKLSVGDLLGALADGMSDDEDEDY